MLLVRTVPARSDGTCSFGRYRLVRTVHARSDGSCSCGGDPTPTQLGPWPSPGWQFSLCVCVCVCVVWGWGPHTVGALFVIIFAGCEVVSGGRHLAEFHQVPDPYPRPPAPGAAPEPPKILKIHQNPPKFSKIPQNFPGKRAKLPQPPLNTT